jgi:hypothetical protein
MEPIDPPSVDQGLPPIVRQERTGPVIYGVQVLDSEHVEVRGSFLGRVEVSTVDARGFEMDVIAASRVSLESGPAERWIATSQDFRFAKSVHVVAYDDTGLMAETKSAYNPFYEPWVNADWPSATSSDETRVFLGGKWMTPGGSARFGDFEIRQTGEVLDSRCPAGVQCVWAGEVSIPVELLAHYPGTKCASDMESVVLRPRSSYAFKSYLVTVTAIDPETPMPGSQGIERFFVEVSEDSSVESLCAGSTPWGESGVRGVLMLGPMCPVVREGEECPDRPGAGVDLSISRTDATGATQNVTTDENGGFSAVLSPGRYQIHGKGARLPVVAPVEFEVRSGSWTELSLSGDSGIR